MKTTTEYKDKSILVLGLAKSGFAAARILNQFGARVTVNDQKPIEDSPEVNELHELHIEVIGGGHPPDLLERKFDLIVKNPGIPYSNPVLQKAQEKSIPIITEVEIAYHISEAEIIGITGSNGKTTTTTLIHEILIERRLPLQYLAFPFVIQKYDRNISFPHSTANHCCHHKKQ